MVSRKTKSNWIITIGVACAVLIAAVAVYRANRLTPIGSSRAGENRTGQNSGLQSSSGLLAGTSWRKELVARQHEAIFVQLWDQLRTNTASLTVIQHFRFGELLIGTPGEPTDVALGISRTELGPPFETLSRDEWHRRVSQWFEKGYRLEQSEWRHPRFDWSDGGAHQSTLAIWLHLVNTNLSERIVLRGQLRVEWGRGADGKPIPQRINATGLELLRRSGETPFLHIVTEAVTGENAPFLEPLLQLYDLDRDGLSEIILPRRNRVYWNQGNGVFRPDSLCRQPLSDIGTALLADFTNEGYVDLLCAHRSGLSLYRGDVSGRFEAAPQRIEFTNDELPNPHVMTAGDVDADGDLDVWAAQYKIPYQSGQMPAPFSDAHDGYASYLLINDGRGQFADCTEASGLAGKRFRRTYSSSFVDLDDDADLDLVVVSDFAGLDLHVNDGRGRFTDVTESWLNENRAFGMAHTLGDYDGDGRLDLFMIGMNSFVAERLERLMSSADLPGDRASRSAVTYGNRLYFHRNGRLVQTAASDQLARTGWSWGATSADFDNDGDLDFYVVNGHISARSAAEYEPQFWLFDLQPGKWAGQTELVSYSQEARARFRSLGTSYGGYEKNRFFLNTPQAGLLEAGYLLGLSLEQDCRNVVADDLDVDGKLDLLVTTFSVWPVPKQELHLFPNFIQTGGNWIGVRLNEHGRGFSPVGAKISITTPRGTQKRYLVTGDSYRSQHAPAAHFGLGNETRVDKVEVQWPNGRRRTLRNPAVHRYHSIEPSQTDP